MPIHVAFPLLSGNMHEARALHERLLPVHPLLYVEGNPAGIKATTALLDLTTSEVRLPLTPLSEAKTKELKAVMNSLKDQ